MRTEDLLERLSADLKPVRRVPHPALSALGWLAVASLAIGVAVALFGLSEPALQRLTRGSLDTAQLAFAGLTSLLAAIAAFQLALPDRSPWWALMPVPTALAWVATMGMDCVQEAQAVGWGEMEAGDAYGCLRFIVGFSVPLTAAFLWLARHAAPMRPATVAVLAGLASATVTNIGLTLVHQSDAALEILVWHGGSALLVVILARAAVPLFRRLAEPALPQG